MVDQFPLLEEVCTRDFSQLIDALFPAILFLKLLLPDTARSEALQRFAAHKGASSSLNRSVTISDHSSSCLINLKRLSLSSCKLIPDHSLSCLTNLRTSHKYSRIRILIKVSIVLSDFMVPPITCSLPPSKSPS